MPTYSSYYTSNEVADLIRRDCQKRTGQTITARHVLVKPDGSIIITISSDQIEKEPKT
jgi:hypothetical protein